jgi:dTDP-N-acetylfucosamine:lipid II N-acetylfucosaminyltransferase
MLNRIIHIAQDEKFINSAYFQFESVLPKQNIFYIVTDAETEGFAHVREQESVFKIKSSELILLASDIKKNDLVVFHSLAASFYPFALRLPKEIKTVWMCFGVEVYNDIHYFSEHQLLDTLTKKHFPSKRISFQKYWKNKLRRHYRLMKPDLPFLPFEIKRNVFARIDYLASSFEEEFSSVQKLIRLNKAFFSFWYYPLEQIVDVNEQLIPGNRNNILIGNSGFSSGNHLDVFEKLKTVCAAHKKIIVPLSYGREEYVDFIVSQGKNQFGADFEPLLEFVSLEVYNNTIKSCGIAILNNKRQQAVGNTIALLWFGSKVFLSSNNPFYHYLKRIGILVFCYETELTKQSIDELLSLEQIERNRTVLFQFLNQTRLLDDLKNQLKVML